MPLPAAPIAVVGDIHGCDDLLESMIEKLSREAQAARMRVIFAGDMIDRGPRGGVVLRRLFALSTHPAPFAQVHCLLGNHERMMLDFLAEPVRNGARWLSHGGDMTLAGLGLAPHSRGALAGSVEVRMTALAAALTEALGPALIAWLRTRPLIWEEGLLVVSHAGADPTRPIAAQDEAALIWGHPGFRKQGRQDGIWVAHGHFIVAQPEAVQGRIAVDTGAWRSGTLSAAILDEQGLRFVQGMTAIGG